MCECEIRETWWNLCNKCRHRVYTNRTSHARWLRSIHPNHNLEWHETRPTQCWHLKYSIHFHFRHTLNVRHIFIGEGQFAFSIEAHQTISIHFEFDLSFRTLARSSWLVRLIDHLTYSEWIADSSTCAHYQHYWAHTVHTHSIRQDNGVIKYEDNWELIRMEFLSCFVDWQLVCWSNWLSTILLRAL